MSIINGTNLLTHGLLQLMAASFNFRPRIRALLRSADGWMNFTVGVRTEDGSTAQSIRFVNGFAFAIPDAPPDADATLIFKDEESLRLMLDRTPDEVMRMLLTSELRIAGNLATMSKFNYFLSVLLEKKHRALAEKAKQEEKKLAELETGGSETDACPRRISARSGPRLKSQPSDAVKFLEDPYLSEYSLDDFPRLRNFLDIHFTVKPEICHERAKLLTDWFRRNGFEADAKGRPWNPVTRQAAAYKHLMMNRRPIIRKDDLIAGTTTTKEIGVVLYPDTHGTMIWGELLSARHRALNPYEISDKTRRILHSDVFPYWEKRNVREWTREKQGNPLCQQLDERFAVYFLWKTAAVSHTIPDFPKLLHLGADGIIAELRESMEAEDCGEEKRATLEAMAECLEGVVAYAENLSAKAAEEAKVESGPARAYELERLSEICARVPRLPARTLDEAVNSLWISWVALHMENTNAGLSLGRLDQALQPFFEADMSKIEDAAERETYLRRAIELVGCFYMRCADHLPLIPDIGNFLFGGSSSDQAITLGGLTSDGKSAVNDMTYIFLKVTEMLSVRDPNVNARYASGVNSDAYLKRLCEVNLATAATPSMHNDDAVIASLGEFDYPIEHARDWSATGCVEPTISGRHNGHTNCMMMNMVAALEMAMNNGRHPLLNVDAGPKTGEIDAGAFETFEQFFDAYCRQFEFLVAQAVEYNNMLAEAHSVIRPTPFLSSLIEGCAEKGMDMTIGGAKYNSSGIACIGLADVSDSLLAVKKTVFDDRKTSMRELKRALDRNFENDAELKAYLVNRAPKFGSGNPEALELTGRVARFTHDTIASHTNFRGGRYTTGFWSMSNHVAFGSLAGALPSGRPAGKPFTPGLTPEPCASDNLLDPIRDVASLDPRFMNNNIAFNVKVVPGASETRAVTVDHMFSYVKTYFDMGGMQMQMNVVTTDMLRDAMKNPDNHRNLIVRISGYNAYFVTLNRQMQMELIERAEYQV
ncbi:MAG: Benzylsuccinate synthase alpha subunit [bacterium ADurb.Bin236]|nr:MAG: Benzylsuccinate synthase alpha subunit [bacterium ADurb.Bin236]